MFNVVRRNTMKTFLLITIACCLGGCGTYGEPLFLAKMFDSADTCQRQNWPNGREPSYCGASSGRTYIYATPNQSGVGRQVGYIKK